MAPISPAMMMIAAGTSRMRTVVLVMGSGPSAADAVGAFQLLPGGVGAARQAGDDLGGVDHDLVALHADGEAVEPARGRALLVLAGLVVLGPVAGALPPLGGRAPGDPAAEVDAALVQGHVAAAGDAPVEARLVVGIVVGDQVEAAVRHVGVAVVALDVGVDLGLGAGLDLGAEAGGQVRPQEVDGAGPEAGQRRPEAGQPGGPEERPPAHLWLLGLRPGGGRPDPRGDRHRSGVLSFV